jgi:hypothetical protein
MGAPWRTNSTAGAYPEGILGDWEIPAERILLGDDPEPLSTAINEYSARRWECYYDLHFNRREIWQLFNLPWHKVPKA